MAATDPKTTNAKNAASLATSFHDGLLGVNSDKNSHIVNSSPRFPREAPLLNVGVFD
jgi:hypothetical protein